MRIGFRSSSFISRRIWSDHQITSSQYNIFAFPRKQPVFPPLTLVPYNATTEYRQWRRFKDADASLKSSKTLSPATNTRTALSDRDEDLAELSRRSRQRQLRTFTPSHLDQMAEH